MGFGESAPHPDSTMIDVYIRLRVLRVLYLAGAVNGLNQIAFIKCWDKQRSRRFPKHALHVYYNHLLQITISISQDCKINVYVLLTLNSVSWTYGIVFYTLNRCIPMCKEYEFGSVNVPQGFAITWKQRRPIS